MKKSRIFAVLAAIEMEAFAERMSNVHFHIFFCNLLKCRFRHISKRRNLRLFPEFSIENSLTISPLF